MADFHLDPQPPVDEKATSLSMLPTWPLVYTFVLGTFVFWIVLLTVLSRMFS